MDNNQIVFVHGDIQLHGLVALTSFINNEDFCLNVDVIQKTSSRSKSGCGTSYGSSTANSCITKIYKLVRVVDHDADKGKPFVSGEWIYIFDKIGREFMGGVEAVRIVMDKYKMASGYKISSLKNDKTRYTSKCKEDGSSWRIHFGPVNGDISRFYLKDANILHSCGVGLGLKSPTGKKEEEGKIPWWMRI
ncbi:uncharacterized protein LOC113317822 [Papaver somniferum]|uniref:uncharacterized protein LOC113317822 n=1 Tax=Papaver somniferum TaxID=3469 RepID=UPI000E6F5DE3|nr:uncharacterized protein LOC113317822 [Papaver somniferum]